MLDANALAVIGLYFTLAGLLGTFFYVHLSSWLQDLLRLKAKWEVNRLGTDDAQRAAIRECRFEIKGLYNHIPFTVALAMSSFIGILAFDTRGILATTTDPLAGRLQNMLTMFSLLYFAISVYLLGHGLYIGRWIANEAKPRPQ